MEESTLKILFLVFLCLLTGIAGWIFFKNGQPEKATGTTASTKASMYINSLKTKNAYRIGDSLSTTDFNKRKGGPHKSELAFDKNGKFIPNELALETSRDYPGTLIEYMVKNKENASFSRLFTEYLKDLGPSEAELEKTAVLHLRLGDKVTRDRPNEKKYYDQVRYSLPDVDTLNAAIFPLLKDMGIEELKIICGLGTPSKEEESLEPSIRYLERVLIEAEKRGVRVDLVKGSPDEDLALLSKAPVSIFTSGGFGLPAVVYENKGHKTFVVGNNAKAKFIQKYLDPRKTSVVVLDKHREYVK